MYFYTLYCNISPSQIFEVQDTYEPETNLGLTPRHA